jgi:hypothetical protein
MPTKKNIEKKNVSRKGGMRPLYRFHVPVKPNFQGTYKLGTGFNVLYPLSLLYKKQNVPKKFSLPSDVNDDISSELNKYPVLKNIVDEEKLKDFFRTMFYNIQNISTEKQSGGKRNDEKQSDGKRNDEKQSGGKRNDEKQSGGSGTMALQENKIALRGESSIPWKAYIAFFLGIIALCFSFYQAYLLNPKRHLNDFFENDPNANVYIKVFEELEQYEPVYFYGIPYPNVVSFVKSASIFALSVALEISKNEYKSTLTRIVGGEQTGIPKKMFKYFKVGYLLVKRNLAGKVVDYSNREIARSVAQIQDTIGIYTGKVEDDIGMGIVLASLGVTLITTASPFVISHLKLLFTKKAQKPKIAYSTNQLAINPSSTGDGSSSDDKPYNPMHVSDTLRLIREKKEK